MSELNLKHLGEFEANFKPVVKGSIKLEDLKKQFKSGENEWIPMKLSVSLAKHPVVFKNELGGLELYTVDIPKETPVFYNKVLDQMVLCACGNPGPRPKPADLLPM